jgi:hypothetical protein
MPPRNPRSVRYGVEIREAAGASLLLTSVDWTESERNLAMSAVLKLAGFKSAAPPRRQGTKTRSGDRAPREKAPQKT